MSAFNPSRLLRLAALLEANAKNPLSNKFDMSVWGKTADVIATNACGTTACAWGSGAVSGIFKREGVSWSLGEQEFASVYDAETGKYHDGKPLPRSITIHYKGHDDDAAAEEFFGISDPEVDYLFTPEAYPSKYRIGATAEKYVADRIRKFVKVKVAGIAAVKKAAKDLKALRDLYENIDDTATIFEMTGVNDLDMR